MNTERWSLRESHSVEQQTHFHTVDVDGQSLPLLLLFLEIEDASLCRRRPQTAQFEKQSLLYKRKQYRDRVIFYATAIKSRAQKRGWKSEWHEMWQPAPTLKDSMTSSAVPQAFILEPVQLKEHKWSRGCGGSWFQLIHHGEHCAACTNSCIITDYNSRDTLLDKVLARTLKDVDIFWVWRV